MTYRFFYPADVDGKAAQIAYPYMYAVDGRPIPIGHDYRPDEFACIEIHAEHFYPTLAEVISAMYRALMTEEAEKEYTASRGTRTPFYEVLMQAIFGAPVLPSDPQINDFVNDYKTYVVHLNPQADDSPPFFDEEAGWPYYGPFWLLTHENTPWYIDDAIKLTPLALSLVFSENMRNERFVTERERKNIYTLTNIYGPFAPMARCIADNAKDIRIAGDNTYNHGGGNTGVVDYTAFFLPKPIDGVRGIVLLSPHLGGDPQGNYGWPIPLAITNDFDITNYLLHDVVVRADVEVEGKYEKYYVFYNTGGDINDIQRLDGIEITKKEYDAVKDAMEWYSHAKVEGIVTRAEVVWPKQPDDILSW